MPDDYSRVFTLIGLALSLVGVLILFRWGMPFHVPARGATYRITNQVDEKEIALERIYTIFGYAGLTLLILGTVLQMAAVLLPAKERPTIRTPAKQTSATTDPLVGYTFKARHAEGNYFNHYGGDILITIWFGVPGPGGHLWDKSIECYFPPGTPVNEVGEPVPPIDSFRVLAPNGDRYYCDTAAKDAHVD
jgi:hypothetical protein